ncbi:MAG: copper amine oxidase family proteinputative S-layer protein [Clostridia bacterium]|nr:copper amine oxidase family proteinputative S-layer protein [Clostridia bacterium]
MLKKKFLNLVIVLTFALSSIVSADGATIKDINTSSNYARAAIEYLAQQNVISGDKIGNFNPQKAVTRAEMVVLIAKALKLDTSNIPAAATFRDVPTNNWAFKYVEAAYREGIITGISATEFKPDVQITREEMAVIFVRALKIMDKDVKIELSNISVYSDQANISSWAKKQVEVAIEAGLMNGVSSTKFEPKKAANKEQSAVVIERLMKNKDEITAVFREQNNEENALYLALDKLVNGSFVGEMRSQGELKLTDTITNLYTKERFDMTDKQNDSYTVASYSKAIEEASNQTAAVSEYQSVTIDKKNFEKDFADNKWVQTNLNTGNVRVYAPFFDPIFEGEIISSIDMNAELLKYFSNIDVKKEGIVYISGVPATKYVMDFDVETIKNSMSEEDYVIVKAFADEVFQGKLSHRYEFYVANNTIIKQSFQFDGNLIDENTGNNINYHSYADIYYKNLGKKFVIAAPPAADIKAVN